MGRITNEDRYVIERMWRAGETPEAIAGKIGVTFASIYREINRGFDGTALSPGRCGYSAAIAIEDAMRKQASVDAGRRKQRKRHATR